MSEYETKPNASVDLQLQMLVADVESKFLAADDALSELRHAVRQLKAYQPQAGATYEAPAMASPPFTPSEPAYTPPPFQAPASPAPDTWAATTEPEAQSTPLTEPQASSSAPRLEEETVGKSFWPGPAQAAPEPEQKPRFEDYGMDSTSEGSWPIARRSELASQAESEPQATAEVEFQAAAEVEKQEPPAWEPEAPEAPAAEAEEDDQARRDEVARFVAQMRDGGDEEDTAPEPVEVDDEEKRRNVADMVAQLRDSAEVEPEEPAENGTLPPGEDDEARRQDVARMVAEMRAGHFDASGEETSPGQEPEGEEDSKREDVANMVAQMRAEMAGRGASEDDETSTGIEDESAASDSDADVRDEVRRAVEAARAEMASGYTGSEKNEAEGGEGDKRFNFTEWQSTHAEPSGPPVIVIKDSEGRVELARVYETLSRVNCDENAALLNYTPHSVTVGLNAKASVPDVDAMTEAVRAIFGRACEVDSDGVRVNVQIGRDLKGKDSAA